MSESTGKEVSAVKSKSAEKVSAVKSSAEPAEESKTRRMSESTGKEVSAVKSKSAVKSGAESGAIDLRIETYSDKAFVVRGDTKPFKDQLGRNGLGGKWNRKL